MDSREMGRRMQRPDTGLYSPRPSQSLSPRSPRPPQPIVPQKQEETKKSPRELRIRLPGFSLKLVAICAVIICVIGAAVFAAMAIKGGLQHDPLPANIKQEAHFTLYYPKRLPDGFHFDEAAYDPATHVVTYDYTTNDGNKLYFSLQPKPSNFNFDNFNKKQLSGAHQVATPLGTATIGILQQETVSSVVAGKTWILISAGEKISLDQLEQVSKSLVEVR